MGPLLPIIDLGNLRMVYDALLYRSATVYCCLCSRELLLSSFQVAYL